MLIRNLCQSHTGQAEIEQALVEQSTGARDGFPLPDVFAMLKASALAADETQKNVQTAETLTRRIEQRSTDIRDTRESVKKLRQELDLQRLEIYRLKILVSKYKLKDEPKRQPFWARSFWEKFRAWSRLEIESDHAPMLTDLDRIEADREKYLKEFPQYRETE
jgi:hypothetical protein